MNRSKLLLHASWVNTKNSKTEPLSRSSRRNQHVGSGIRLWSSRCVLSGSALIPACRLSLSCSWSLLLASRKHHECLRPYEIDSYFAFKLFWQSSVASCPVHNKWVYTHVYLHKQQTCLIGTILENWSCLFINLHRFLSREKKLSKFGSLYEYMHLKILGGIMSEQ